MAEESIRASPRVLGCVKRFEIVIVEYVAPSRIWIECRTSDVDRLQVEPAQSTDQTDQTDQTDLQWTLKHSHTG